MTDYLHMTLAEDTLRQISSLGLAHVGDAVYELLVRTWLCTQGKVTSKGLHAAAVSYVSAGAQAEASVKIAGLLTPAEQAIFRRGRNTRVHSVPSRATIEEYHAATGLETLFGYLYLTGQETRVNELFAAIMEGEDNAS